MDLSALQAHQEVGGTDFISQHLDDHAISSYVEYAVKGDDVERDIESELHTKTVKIYWFKKPISNQNPILQMKERIT